MIRFLLNGLLRDRHRSLFPVIVVIMGVLLTTILYSWMSGIMNDMVDYNARFDAGHVKVTTRAYDKIANQLPNDLGLTGISSLIQKLSVQYPDYEWTARTKFAGLLDIPDSNGETKAQFPIFGMAIDLSGKDSKEADRLKLAKAIIAGHMPKKPGEILISDEFAKRTGVGIKHPVTLLSTSSSGAMAIQNFIICGTVQFGIAAIDRGAIIADLADIQYALEMPDGSGEILGFDKHKFYQSDKAYKLKVSFNNQFYNPDDQFSPVMQTLEDQNGLGEYLNYARSVGFLIVGIFLVAMSVVLWNASLMSGIRRYGEIGVRLALGESKNMIFKTLLYESLLIGIAGSIIGTAAGVAVSYYFQKVGLDMSGTFKNSALVVTNTVRAQVNFTSFYIGFIPGLLATLLGTIFSGVQVFKRQTASLFKELEA